MPAGYRLAAYRRIEKDLTGFPQRTQESIRERIRALADDPRPSGAVRLQGRPDEHFYRVRVGDYRIVYDIRDDERVVRIILVGHRRDVYSILGRR